MVSDLMGTDAGRKDVLRSRGLPVSVDENSARWFYHIFLIMVLRLRGPSARAELRYEKEVNGFFLLCIPQIYFVFIVLIRNC